MREDRYQRQSIQLTAKMQEQTVGVIGVGGVGSWVGQQLALLGVQGLYLYDHDVVDIHNLNRSVFREDDVGKPKVNVFSNFCYELNPAVKVLPSNVQITSVREIPNDINILFSAVDNVETRLLLQKWAKASGKRLVIDCGTSVSTTEGTVCQLQKNKTPVYQTFYGDAWDEMMAYEQATPACQRRSEPAIVTLTSAVATLAIHLFIEYVMDGELYSGLFQFNWGKLPIMTFFEMDPQDWDSLD